jgi:hypothetical protein
MTSHQLKNPYGFFAPYIPMPKGRGFTALLVSVLSCASKRTPLVSAHSAGSFFP